MSFPKTSIAFVTESLGSGGAERQLIELVKCLSQEHYSLRIMTYTSPNYYFPEAQKANVPVITLIRRSKWDFRPVFKLAKWLSSGEVDIVHAYLPTANLYAVLAKVLAKRGKVIVSQRSTVDDYHKTARFLRKSIFKYADMSVTNSQVAYKELSCSLHLTNEKLSFIPNGIDLEEFYSVDSQMREVLREKLGWDKKERIVLTVASFKAAKNYSGFLKSLTEFQQAKIPVRFFWVGHVEDQTLFLEIKRRIIELGLEHLVVILEPREDVANLYRACDIFALNSLWEGTPNVVLEAMACGCPVIATDVGDVSRYVIPGKTGWLLPPNDPKILRDALESASRLSEQDLKVMGVYGRQHLLGLKMDSGSMAHSYVNIYSQLMGRKLGVESSSIG